MADIFISYRSMRRPAVRYLTELLEAHGYTVWYDHALLSGKRFAPVIERELRAAKAVIVVWCRYSTEISEDNIWVPGEAARALSLGTLVPVLLEKVDIPLPYNTLNTIDLTEWDGDPRGSGLDPLLEQLILKVGREPPSSFTLLKKRHTVWHDGGKVPWNGIEIDLIRIKETQRLEKPIAGSPEPDTSKPQDDGEATSIGTQDTRSTATDAVDTKRERIDPQTEVVHNEPEYDDDAAYGMISEGRAIPQSWREHVTELTYGIPGCASISDLSGVEGLLNLEALCVSRTPVRDLIPLAGLKRLRVLDVSETSVDDICPLSEVSALEDLNLDQCPIIDIAPLKKLMNLAKLDLSDTLISDVSDLRGVSSLRELYLGHTDISDVSSLSKLKALENLAINGTKVTDVSFLQGMSSLKTLSISHTEINDISDLWRLRNLEYLYMDGTDIENIDILKDLTELKDLSLGSVRKAVDLAPLSKLRNLKKLSLCFYKPIDLSPISQIENLDELDFSYSGFLDLSTLKNAKQVKKLKIWMCPSVSDISALRNLTGLKELDIRLTRVKDITSLDHLVANGLEIIK